MALVNHVASFVPTSAIMELAPDIAEQLAAIAATTPSAATDIDLTTIRLHLRRGDDAFARRRYDAALSEFNAARALIYKQLNPGFDQRQAILWGSLLLPASKAIETKLVTASVSLLDIVVPTSVAVSPGVGITEPPPLNGPFASLLKTGFHDSSRVREVAEGASMQAIAFLEADRPAQAAAVLEAAKADLGDTLATEKDAAAAIHLNLATAYIQLGQGESAVSAAKAATTFFQADSDVEGQAQALHATAAAVSLLGDTAAATDLASKASSLLTATKTRWLIAAAAAGAGAGGANDTFQGATLQSIPLKLHGKAVDLSRAPESLDPIVKKRLDVLTVRQPGRNLGWTELAVSSEKARQADSKPWSFGTLVGQEVVQFNFTAQKSVSAEDLVSKIYDKRKAATVIADLGLILTESGSTSLYLTHLYSYLLPRRIGQTLNALGRYAKAEENFQQASAYSYINTALEAPGLWIDAARNALTWGDSLYKGGAIDAAKTHYAAIVSETFAAPTSFLYTTPAFATPAADARQIIDKLWVPDSPVVNAEVAQIVLVAAMRLRMILDGLDFMVCCCRRSTLLNTCRAWRVLQRKARCRQSANLSSSRPSRRAKRPADASWKWWRQWRRPRPISPLRTSLARSRISMRRKPHSTSRPPDSNRRRPSATNTPRPAGPPYGRPPLHRRSVAARTPIATRFRRSPTSSTTAKPSKTLGRCLPLPRHTAPVARPAITNWQRWMPISSN